MLAFAPAALAAEEPSVVTPSGLDAPAAGPRAAAVPTDTLTRIPGAKLRFGWTHERTAALGQFPRSGGGASETREGEVTWFGYPARAALSYRSGRLAEVRLVATSPTRRLAEYVPDELRRRGYRRVGLTVNGPMRVSEWSGPAKVKLTAGSGSLVAEFSLRVEAAPPAAPEPEPEPVDLTAADSTGIEPRRTFTPEPPRRPQVAVDAGVFGRVFVRVVVGRDGVVRRADVERSIPELDHAAIEWASEVRFEPWRVDGRAVPFVTRIPVAFLPEGATTPGKDSP